MKPTFTLCLALAIAAAPALAIPLSVTVVGPDDKPLAGAVISIVEGKTPSDDKATPRDIAGENGRFTFDWDGVFPAKDKPISYEDRRYVYVRAQSPGLTTQTLVLDKAQNTIRLQTARSWGGVVRDVNDKPVAGVKIELSRWSANNKSDEMPLADGENAPELIAFAPLVDAWKVSAITGADGRWQLDNMPRKATASVMLDDARFVKKSFELNIGENDAPPLFVRAGATITGVLLRPDGAPIAEAPVSVGWNNGGETRTDAQGRFTLGGVEPGEVTLSSGADYWSYSNKKAVDYVVPQEKVSAIAGETTDVGTWKAVAGLLVKAQIVDEATKEPVKGARVNFYNGTMISSDEQGQISGRILPATLRQGMGTIGSVYAGNYVQAQIPQPVVDKDAATLDLGTISLTRGTVLNGTVRVEGEDGKTIAGAPNLRLNGGNFGFDFGSSIDLWSGKPEFTTQALKPGNYTLQLDNGKDKNKQWEIVSPQKVTVPPTAATADGEAKKALPIEIVLKRLAPAAPSLGTVTGRVADAQGNGIGGAVVNMQLRAGNTYTRSQTLTDSDGSFEVARSNSPRWANFDAVEIKSIERPGYLWASQPKFETRDGATTISNLTLKKRGAVFSGRALGADGQGAAGAWVAVLEARDYQLVQAGADGKFEMTDLPAEKFTVIGAGVASFGRAQTEADAQNFVLALQPNAASDREALAARALEGKVEWWNAQQYWEVMGTERMAELLMRSGEKEGRNYAANEFATQLAKRDPAEFLKRAPALIELAGKEGRDSLEAKLFALRAASDEADDRIAANAWLDEQKAEKREINARSVTRLLEMAVVADKLKREDAAGWLDYAAAIAAQLKSGVEGQSNGWGTALAQIGASAMPAFVEEMKPPVEFAFWQGASVGLAKNGDLSGAKSALARMETLAKTPELIEQGKKRQWDNPAAQLDRARQGVALALAETDAKSALEMMPASGNDWNRVNGLLVIADRAVAAKDRATAEKVLGQIAGMKTGNVEKFALAASLAQQLDPKLAAPMWANALQRTMPGKGNDFDFYRPSVGMWAFYHARLDAARSRVLLEREWTWRLPAAVKTKDEQYSSDGQILNQLEMGMAAVAPFRALEMRDEARAQIGKPDVPASADIGLAAAILATPAQSTRFGVDARF